MSVSATPPFGGWKLRSYRVAHIKTKDMSELIGLIHDAALAPSLWPESINRIRVALSGSAALLFTPQHDPGTGGFAIPENLSADLMARYAEKYHRIDLWTQAGVKRKLFIPGTVASDEDLVPRQILIDSPYYREFLEPANISRLCTSVIFGEDEPAVLPTVISIYRGVDAQPFGPGAKSLLRLLIPHLSRSLALMYRLRDAEQKLTASLAALDKIPNGVVLFGQHGNVVHTNAAASTLLAQNDGIGFETRRTTGRYLTTSSNARNAVLTRLVDNAISPSNVETCTTPRGMRLPRWSDRPPIVISVSPLPPKHQFENVDGQALAIGFLFDSGLPRQPDPQLLQDTYGLTPAEIRLVCHLCDGWVLGKIAHHLGLSTETLKSQLKNVFIKMGASRQIEVINLASALSIKR